MAACMNDSTGAASANPLHHLYREHHGWLQSWLRHKLHSCEQAADLAQDTFLRILASRESTRQAADLREPRSYLATVARRVVVDHLRRQSLERAYLDALAALPEPADVSPETRTLIVEALCRIDAMLDGLGRRARQAFLMSQLEGLSYAQIAVQLGVSTSSVKKYVARAVEQCLLLMMDSE